MKAIALARLHERALELTEPADLDFVARLRRLITTDPIRVPRFPDVPLALDRLLQQPDVGHTDIVRTLQRDPELVGQVWKHGSTAVFPRPPRDLDEAISRVGLDEIWRIGVGDALRAMTLIVPGYEARIAHLQLHGMVTAEIASWLAQERRGPMFLAGLMHDIGELLVLREAVDPRSRRRPSAATVRLLVGDVHAELGLLAAEEWGLGLAVSMGILWHHEPRKAPAHRQRVPLLVCIADGASEAALSQDSAPVAKALFDELSAGASDFSQVVSMAAAAAERLRKG